MTTQEIINILSFLFVSVGTVLGWRVITQDARKKKLEGDQTITSSRKIEAETMETITSSAGQVVETYKQILDKLEVELDKCEAENHKLLSRIATLEKAAKSLKGERRDGTN